MYGSKNWENLSQEERKVGPRSVSDRPFHIFMQSKNQEIGEYIVL